MNTYSEGKNREPKMKYRNYKTLISKTESLDTVVIIAGTTTSVT